MNQSEFPPRMAEYSTRLAAMFGRPKDGRFSYEEASQLADLSRHPAFEEELTLVCAFWATEKRFFPHSLARLLRDWTTVIDHARRKGIKTVTVLPSRPVAKLKGEKRDDATYKRMAAQVAEQRKAIR